MTRDNEAGFPRPVLPKDGKNTPVPWIGDDGPAEGVWARVSGQRGRLASDHDLCIVCGETLTEDWVLCLAFGNGIAQISPLAEWGVGSPTPTWTHPKCALIAALYCPHLQNQEHPAETQDGTLLTVEDLKKLSHAAPTRVS